MGGRLLTGINNSMQYTSARQPLIATLSYPGLAIKGIASVGPTLDIFDQVCDIPQYLSRKYTDFCLIKIIGVIQIVGTMQIGATYNFEKCEVYFPETLIVQVIKPFRTWLETPNRSSQA